MPAQPLQPVRARARGGFALVMVLGSLVFLSALVLAFFSSVTSDLQVSKSYASGTEVKMLSETAVNVVMAQITEATTTDGGESTWASQPGAIRTYGQSGNPGLTYKLYSADNMIAGGALAPTADAAPADWASRPALYTDLNHPVDDINGNLSYPILDPPDSAFPVIGYSILSDPAVNPGAFAGPVMPVKWLYVLQDGQMVAPTAQGANAVKVTGASATNPIVGRIAFWTDDETCKVNINTAAGDLWNDTQYFGSFWDTPFFADQQEYDLAEYQPMRMEYQRYPGHPATVYLSAVFPDLSREELYALIPRIEDGGSQGGRVRNTDDKGWSKEGTDYNYITLDRDRLYASVDEFLFADEINGSKRVDHAATTNKAIDRSKLEHAKFFLTANSRAPEVTLFGTPRLSMWPIHSSYAGDKKSPYTTPYDRLIAFCSTLKGSDFYFIQRQNAMSPTEDAAISRNQRLYSYLQDLTGRPVPGFGGNFKAKYPADRDQILTEMVDYIRCVNLFDDFLVQQVKNQYPWSPGTYPTDVKAGPYTFTRQRLEKYKLDKGHGFVVPLQIGDTRGMGRAYTVSEAGFIFLCSGKGDLKGFITSKPPLEPDYVQDDPDPSDGVDEEIMDWLKKWTLPPGQSKPDPNKPSVTIQGWNKTLTSELAPNQRRIQAMFVLELNTPSMGYPHIVPDVTIEVEGLDQFRINGQSLNFPSGSDKSNPLGNQYATLRDISGSAGFHSRRVGGALGIRGVLGDRESDEGRKTIAHAPLPPDQVVVDADIQLKIYPLISGFVTVTLPSELSVNNESATMSFGSSGDGVVTIKLFAGEGTSKTLIQTLKMKFPDGQFPVPQLIPLAHGNVAQQKQGTYPFGNHPASHWTFSNDGMPVPPSFMTDPPPARGRLRWLSENPDSNGPIFKGDVVRTLVHRSGDIRTLMGKQAVVDISGNPSDQEFVPHPDYFSNSKREAHSMISPATGTNAFQGTSSGFGKLVDIPSYDGKQQPDVPQGVESSTAVRLTGDWDNGIASFRDGAYINMPDAGNQHRDPSQAAPYPYFSDTVNQVSPGATFFSPNRLVASAGYFGSLPTGVRSGQAFQTLLFRPQPSHPSHSLAIPDHLMMDLFSMPVVEPYAISEPFSTAGKINMNYQLVPFTHIERSTALQAAMRGERVSAVANADAATYKKGGSSIDTKSRFPILLGESSTTDAGTLSQFMKRFAGAPYAFKSATEICDLYLVPDGGGATVDTMETFWNAHKLTGDNAKERPYARLYQKLTTKSNTYTVHYRVQSLQQPRSATQDEWTEGRGRVVGDYRGSTIIERFVDPANPDLPDFATSPRNASGGYETLDDFYRFRVVSSKQFNP